MQAIPAMPMEPASVPPAGKTGLNLKPVRAETSFKQQLTNSSQNNDSSSQLAESSEQIPDEMAEETSTGIVSQQVSISSVQIQRWLGYGQDNINHTGAGKNQPATGMQPDEMSQVILLANIINKEAATNIDRQTNIAEQILPAGKQTGTFQENINHKTEIINQNIGKKAKIIDEQSLQQLRAETVFTKQENKSATLVYGNRELIGQEGYRQKNINPSMVTLSPIRDTNGNYIQANLPDIAIINKNNLNNNLQQQQQGSGEKGKTNYGNIFQLEQNNLGKISTQDTPLIFSLSRESTPGLMTGTSTMDSTASLRLPSGTEVLHRSIVDQVINRFAMNRALDPGTITIKMYPAELGELHIKIRIDQENIRAHITTQNPQVQEILDRYMTRLRDSLEEQGLNLEHIEVSVNDNSENNEQHFRGQFNQYHNDKRETNNFFSSISLEDDPVEENNNQLPESDHKLSILI